LRDFSKIQNKANAFMDKILGSGMETTITYKMFVSDSYDDSTGMKESVYSEYEIDSIKVDASLQAQLASSIMAGISFGAGEIIYLIKHEDMPRTDVYSPNILKDFVSDNGEEKQVKMAVPLLKTFIKIQV
jgi:hypothetical protein